MSFIITILIIILCCVLCEKLMAPGTPRLILEIGIVVAGVMYLLSHHRGWITF